MKYKLFRSPGDLDKAVRTHELVAVETGKRIMMWQTRLFTLSGTISRRCRSMRTARLPPMHRSRSSHFAG